MKIEAFAATRMQDGNRSNEDAYALLREAPLAAVLCDGAGNAQGVARNVTQQFEAWKRQQTAEALATFPPWSRLLRQLDANLQGRPESTFLALAVLDTRVVGACAGDTRLYRFDRDGELHIESEGASKKRLGSGDVQPFPLHFTIEPGELLLMMTDGAWTPLSHARLRQALARRATLPTVDLASALLDEAGRTGRADDMTIVVMKAKS
jgi:serine/threonine protein phosphatase PrpC